MKYKITFLENDRINSTCVVEAESKSKAMVAFWVDHPEASDVSKVEKLQDAEND